MMINMIGAMVLAVVAVASPASKVDPGEARQRFMEATGGFVERAGEGKVAVVNCQRTFARAELEKLVVELGELAKVAVELMDGEYRPYIVPDGYEMALYVVEDEKLPLSLVAVECGWGMVNVAALEGDGKLFARQFNRAAALTLGAGVSKFTTSIMQPVKDVEGLKKIVGTGIPMDIAGAMRFNLRGHGVTETQRVIYRQAVAQGWAPAPTNDAQRVIWEQMHAKPTQPMTIKYKKK